MNILYLTQFFSATRGGGEVIFHSFAERMAQRGHRVFVICHESENASEHNVKDIEITHVKPSVLHKGGLPPSITQNVLYIMNALRAASRIVKKEKIDIIHTNNFSPTLAGSIVSRIYRIPVVNTVHDVFTDATEGYWQKWASQNNVSWISSKIGPLFERLTVKMSTDALHTVSYATRDDLIRFGVKSQIIVIHNGIDASAFSSAVKSTSPNSNYVVFIGRLVFYKNLEVVICAFEYVVKSLPHAKLYVVGDGPMRDEWEKLVKSLGLENNIHFLGYLSQEKKVEYLAGSSALILPSLVEGFGLVLLESFAIRKPVLVAKVRPFDEIVTEGEDGFMIDPRNSEEWAQRILQLLSSPHLSKEMGEAGWRKLRAKFDITEVIDRMESLYMELRAGKPNGA